MRKLEYLAISGHKYWLVRRPSVHANPSLAARSGAGFERGVGTQARDAKGLCVAGLMVGSMHSITRERVPRDFPEQVAATLLRALGLPEQEVAQIATRPLAMPVIEPGALLWRLIKGRDA